MIVERVEVRCVRNVTEASLDLCPGLNVLVGPNGAGKTALLEALHLLIRGRSFRGRGVSFLLQHGAPALSVHLRGSDPVRGRVTLGMARERSSDTELRLNGEAVRQASVVAGLLPMQLLLPDLAELVFGSPRERRQWLDWGVFHVKHDYVDTLRDYVRSVRQRNAVLRTEDHETLQAWTGRMIELGEAVTEARQEYFDAVRPTVLECLETLAPGLAVTLEYHPGFQGDSLAEEVAESTPRDVKSGATQVGPHRADIRLGSERGRAAGGTVQGPGQGACERLADRPGEGTTGRAGGPESVPDRRCLGGAGRRPQRPVLWPPRSDGLPDPGHLDARAGSGRVVRRGPFESVSRGTGCRERA